MDRESPGGPAAGTQHRHSCSPGQQPWSGKQDLTSFATKTKRVNGCGATRGSVVNSSAKVHTSGSIPGLGITLHALNNSL